VAYPVLEFREEKQTIAKVERGNVDYFLSSKEKMVAYSLSFFCQKTQKQHKVGYLYIIIN
jgi:hypothetical protein